MEGSTIGAFDRQVARWGGIVTLIAGTGVVITYAGGAISQIRHFDWYFKVPLTAFSAALVLTVASRLVVYGRHRKDLSPQAPSVYGPQFAHFAGDASGVINMERNEMRIIQAPTVPPVALPPIPSSPDLLKALAGEMEALGREIPGIFPERRYPPMGLSSEETERLYEDESARERVALEDYRMNYHPRALQLYEQARSRGYPDEMLETETHFLPNNKNGVDTMSTRLSVLAERIRFDLRHDPSEEPSEEAP